MQRDLEAAVAGEQGGPVAGAAAGRRADDEVGHAGAVVGRGEVLLGAQAVGVEARAAPSAALDASPPQVAAAQRGRREEAGRRRGSTRRSSVGVGGAMPTRGRAGRAGEGPSAPMPPAASRGEHVEPGLHVLEHGERRRWLRVQAKPASDVCVVGLEQHGEVALAGQEVVERRGEQRAGGVASCPPTVHACAARSAATRGGRRRSASSGTSSLASVAARPEQVRLVV